METPEKETPVQHGKGETKPAGKGKAGKAAKGAATETTISRKADNPAKGMFALPDGVGAALYRDPSTNARILVTRTKGGQVATPLKLDAEADGADALMALALDPKNAEGGKGARLLRMTQTHFMKPREMYALLRRMGDGTLDTLRTVKKDLIAGNPTGEETTPKAVKVTVLNLPPKQIR